MGPWSIYISNVYEFCWPMYTDLGRPGGYIYGCGQPSNLVKFTINWPKVKLSKVGKYLAIAQTHLYNL